MQEINVIDTNVCGRMLYYPDCPVSKMVADLVKQKYLTDTDLKIMEKHKYHISHEDRK